MGHKQDIKDEFASMRSFYNLLKTLVAVGLFIWGLIEFKVEDYVDGRVEIKLEENKTPVEEKLSYKLAKQIDGAEQDDVHKYIGGMFNSLSLLTDSLNDFKDKKLPKLMRLTELVWVGPVIDRSHAWYIDFDNQPYRIRGIGTSQPYWRDANNVKRDLAGREIN